MPRWASISRDISRSAGAERKTFARREKNRLISDLFREQFIHEAGHPAPALGFGGQSFRSRPGDGIEAGFPAAFGFLPGTFDEALLFEADQRRVEGALIESQEIIRNLVDA